MAKPSQSPAREFLVVTHFQKAARRPGGLSREEALQAAKANIDRIKPEFAAWLEAEINTIRLLVKAERYDSAADSAFIESVRTRSTHLAEVATTMGYPLVSFIATNLRSICDAVSDGAAYDRDVASCHVDALVLAKQQRYSRMQPEDLPALRGGLKRLIESKNLLPLARD
jgi:hypothetical protein